MLYLAKVEIDTTDSRRSELSKKQDHGSSKDSIVCMVQSFVWWALRAASDQFIIAKVYMWVSHKSHIWRQQDTVRGWIDENHLLIYLHVMPYWVPESLDVFQIFNINAIHTMSVAARN